MRVELLVPDIAPAASTAGGGAGFAQALDMLERALGDAASAEDVFANGSGTLHGAVYERARADVALSVATAAASRAVQSVQSILSMQV